MNVIEGAGRLAAKPEVGLDPDRDLVAYFCMEYGIDERLDLYAGGLGVLAGDHLKAARDAGVPLVGVGLFYRQGYFTQTIDASGRQRHEYREADPTRLPLRRVRRDDGEQLQVEVRVGERKVQAALWAYDDPDIRLLLLDADVAGNDASARRLAARLYGGDREARLGQEILLGIGGVRALRALGLSPTVWHANEGHSALQIVERCREFVEEGFRFGEALELVAAATVFTTHTSVPAGHDVFPAELVDRYLGPLADELGIERREFLALGASPSSAGAFNMTALALRGSRFRNGVSRIHHDIAAHLDNYVWPEVPPLENPIGWVSNGVHAETWIAEEWGAVLDEHVGRWRGPVDEADLRGLEEVPDDLVWQTRRRIKARALEWLQRAAAARYRRHGRSDNEIDELTRYLSPQRTDVLTIGFARRFATYKRATLLLNDIDALARLLGDEERPVVMLYAGKAHPRDDSGQQLIRQLHEASLEPPFRGHIVLLEGYGLELARHLVAGVDVWMNTPEAPLEASGTSGQKAAMNGVLNVSVLDGWWAEGFTGDNGWAIAPHRTEADAPHRDRVEAREILGLLRARVVPAFFERDEGGLPRRWIRMAKAAMRSTIGRFGAVRMVRQYADDLYGPAARHSRRLAADNGAAARQLAAWKQRVLEAWHHVRLEIPAADADGVGVPRRVIVTGADLRPEELAVERVRGRNFETREFEVRARTPYRPATHGNGGVLLFEAPHAEEVEPAVPSSTDEDHEEERLRAYPVHPLLAHPFELGRMVWLERED